jgi:hypothetical protein
MKTRALGIAAAVLLLSACGGDDGPTTPSGPPPPNVAGTYVGYPMWVTQYNRTHDGYNGSFSCPGSLTIAQVPGSTAISGFAVVSSPCPPLSFELTGTVQAGGAITFFTQGPRPPGGPCPTPGRTTFNGVVGDTLSARGTVMVECPGAGEGEYRFDQIVTAWKN